MPTFDYTISLGAVINLGGLLVVLYVGWVSFRVRVDTVLANQKELMTALVARFEAHERLDRELFQEVQGAISGVVREVSHVAGRLDAQS